MNRDVTIEIGVFGPRAVLHSAWLPRLAEDLLARGVVELELNQGKGWQGKDLLFLSQLPNLMAFEIHDFNIKNIEPIHSLHKLKRLDVGTYCSTEIDFD